MVGNRLPKALQTPASSLQKAQNTPAGAAQRAAFVVGLKNQVGVTIPGKAGSAI